MLPNIQAIPIPTTHLVRPSGVGRTVGIGLMDMDGMVLGGRSQWIPSFMTDKCLLKWPVKLELLLLASGHLIEE